MGRSVVLAGGTRCPGCSLPPRWCVCDAFPAVAAPCEIHVLIHHAEQWKPSSTGRLLGRTIPTARLHTFQRASRFQADSCLPASTVTPGQDLWILHPAGEPLTAHGAVEPAAHAAAWLVLDGTWRQAGEMLRAVEHQGRCVSLPQPVDGSSRYWLRDQPGPRQLSTAETVIEVFAYLNATAAAHQLRLHFELHVYSSLLARGKREMAERYLGLSPLLTAAPEVVDRLLDRQVPPPAIS